MAYAEYYKACLAGDVAKILAAVAQENRREFEAFSKDRQAMVVALLRDRPASIRIAAPVVSAAGASLSIEGRVPAGQKATGSITMVTEEGKWKVSRDRWTMSQE